MGGAGNDAFDLELGRAHAGGFAGLGTGDGHIQHRRHAPHTGDIVFQIRRIGNRVRVDQEIGQLGVGRVQERIEGRLECPELVVEFGPVEFERPDVEIGLCRGRQFRAVELRLHTRNAAPPPFEPRQDCDIAVVVELVLPVLDAEPRRKLRTLF